MFHLRFPDFISYLPFVSFGTNIHNLFKLNNPLVYHALCLHYILSEKLINKTRIWIISQKLPPTYFTLFIRPLLLQNAKASGCDWTDFFSEKHLGLEQFYRIIFSQNWFIDMGYSADSKLAGASMIAWANNWGQKIPNLALLAWNCLDRLQRSGYAESSSSCS